MFECCMIMDSIYGCRFIRTGDDIYLELKLLNGGVMSRRCLKKTNSRNNQVYG